MGVKVPIGYYKYNPNRPKWAINLGGLMQGLSPFLGIFSVLFAIIISNQYGLPAGIFCGIAIFAAAVLFWFGGRRLALGEAPVAKNVDPDMIKLIAKLRARGVSDQEIVSALHATKNGTPVEEVVKKLTEKAPKTRKK
jgi:hypothetical protein